MRNCFWIAIIMVCSALGLVREVAYASTISAKVTLSDYLGAPTSVPITVQLLQGGSIKYSQIVFLDSSDRIVVNCHLVYDVRIKASHWLSAFRANVNASGNADLGTVTLINGDCDSDDEITSTDLSILGLALGSTPGSSNWDPTSDLDGDEEITSTDLSILGQNLGKSGESVETREYVYVPAIPTGTPTPSLLLSETYSTIGSTSSQGHSLEYSFIWGDGTSSLWAASSSASHIWTSAGVKIVSVATRCQAHPNLSAISTSGLAVNVVDAEEMVYIPAGSFLMGNSGIGNDAVYASSIELPQHMVTLSGYYIGRYEVTRGWYREFINAGGYTNPVYWSSDGWSWRLRSGQTEPAYWAENQNWRNSYPGPQPFIQTDKHPVIGVTYFEAEAFCNWAGGRLPTEAEWERAARWTGSKANVYPWGDIWDAENCNDDEDHNPAGGGGGRAQTAPVGSYLSGVSPCGCMDMVGNASEWCQDWWKSFPGCTMPFDDTNISRTQRGAAFSGHEWDTRCIARYGLYPDEEWNGSGFRIAR